MDKEKEKRAYSRVYGPGCSVFPYEGPDFMTQIEGLPSLGIEVTEFYSNESSARLQNHRRYLHALMNGGRVYAPDRDTIITGPFKVSRDAGKEEFEIQGVAIERPSGGEFIQKLIEIVSGKNQKALKYLEQCPQVDLVIEDSDSSFPFESIDGFLKAIQVEAFDTQIRLNVLRGPFREINVIFNEGAAKKWVPLRSNIFFGDLFCLSEILDKKGLGSLEPAAELRLIVGALYCLGHHRMFINSCEEPSLIHVGAFRFKFDNGNVSALHSHHLNVSEASILISDFWGTLSDSEGQFARELAENRSKFLAVAPIGFPCYEIPDLDSKA